MFLLPGLVENVEPSNVHTPVPLTAPVACREGVGDIASDAGTEPGALLFALIIEFSFRTKVYDLDNEKLRSK